MFVRSRAFVSGNGSGSPFLKKRRSFEFGEAWPPVVDIVCSDEDYGKLYALAGLALLETHRPLASPEESHDWVSETRIAPWVLYVIGKS